MTIMQESGENPNRVFTVSDVNFMVRDLVEGSFYPLWITGEVGNLTIHRSGHVYMTMKDASSQIRAVYFNGASVCSSLGLREGTKIEAFGRLSVYSARGEYQFNVRSIRLNGIGDLQAKFEELKQKLAAEGLFDDTRKKPIPYLPRCIGVVTSTSGAALYDFIRIARARYPGVKIKVCPAAVQGKGAEQKLARAVRFFNRTGCVDVIVVTRGGGSLEDLWPFNEEVLARAIAESRIPVVSAVGHEIDFTIADFAADLRAPTPSGAAEMIVPEERVLRQALASCRSRMDAQLNFMMERQQMRLDKVRKSRAFLDLFYQTDELAQRIDRNMENARKSLLMAEERTVLKFRHLSTAMNAYGPYQVLQRGYAIVTDANGRIVASEKSVSSGDLVKIRVADGVLDAVIGNSGK